MTTKKTTSQTTSLRVPGVKSIPYYGSPFVLFERGVDMFEKIRINGQVELLLDDGATAKATVQDVQVGALINLLTGYSAQSVYTIGRASSPLTTLQAIADASSDGEAVPDPRQLYTAVTVVLQQPDLSPPM